MSQFYDDDEKDYYRGEAWGGSTMKSIYESSVREKFTLDEDEDVSPSFSGESPAVFGGSYELKRHAAQHGAKHGAPYGGAKAPKRISIRSAFGGNPSGDSTTSDSDISLADLLSSGSDSDVSEEDVRDVKAKYGGSSPTQQKKLDKYQEMKAKWRHRNDDSDHGGNHDSDHDSEQDRAPRRSQRNVPREIPRDVLGGTERCTTRSATHGAARSAAHGATHGAVHGGRYRDKSTGRFNPGAAPYGGRDDGSDDHSDDHSDDDHRDVPRTYGLFGGTSHDAVRGTGSTSTDSDSEGMEKLW